MKTIEPKANDTRVTGEQYVEWLARQGKWWVGNVANPNLEHAYALRQNTVVEA